MQGRGWVTAVFLTAFLCAFSGFADKKKAKPLSAAEVFKRTNPAIVAIDCYGDDNVRAGTATGFLVSSNGKIVTNYHVISSCQNVKVRLANGDIYDTADVLETDPRKDLALIRIKAVSMPVLALADSNAIEIGEPVFNIGNANGFQNTLQQGLVSGFRQFEGFKVVQVSASINFGNSGGPILDDQARVIAVAAARIPGAENMGFAIPINYAKGYLDSTNSTPFPVFAASIKKTTPVVPPPPPPTPSPKPKEPQPAAPRPTFTTVHTIAGKPWKFEGDGMRAIEVPLGHVHGVAWDRSGNMYASDISSQAIVKIDTTGILHVLAGPNSPPADRPVFPQQIAVDSFGAVYFAENGDRVRKILPDGRVVSIAGSGRRAFSPDGSVASISALNGVTGVAVAPDGSVIFAEWGNNRIRRVDAQGLLQTVGGDGGTQFAGDGGVARQASFPHPLSVAVDGQGNVYVADQSSSRVRKISTDGSTTTVAGGGVTKESLACPSGVAVNSRNDVFIADPCRRRVFRLRN